MFVWPDNFPDRKLVMELVSQITSTGGRLLFIVVGGSRLLGTHTKDSDWDLRGVYAPSAMELSKNKSTYVVNTSKYKNDLGILDMSIHPINSFLEKLAMAEAFSVNMYFSQLDPYFVLYRDPVMDMFHHKGLIAWDTDIPEDMSFCKIARSHCEHTQVKASDFSLVQMLYERCNKAVEEKSWKICSDILSEFPTCIDNDYIAIVGKRFEKNASIKKLQHALKILFEKYGSRTRKALETGYDGKAFSHALIGYNQAYELWTRGRLDYPISCIDKAMAIKYNNVSLEEAEKYINEEKNRLKNITRHPDFLHKQDKDMVENILQLFY